MISKLFMIGCLLIISLTSGAPVLKGAPLVYKTQVVKDIIKEIELNEEIKELENSEFTPQNLRRYLELKHVKHSEVVLRQAILETSWFKSSSFKRGNNLFGMKLLRKRETLANGSYLRHASYNHWTDSVKDYLLWQNYHLKYPVKDYYIFLNNIGYATANNYTCTLKYINLDRLDYM